MAQIPTALGIYEDADGNRLARYETGKDKWVIISEYWVNTHIRQTECKFIHDEDVASCMPLKRVSHGRAE